MLHYLSIIQLIFISELYYKDLATQCGELRIYNLLLRIHKIVWLKVKNDEIYEKM